MKKIIKVAGALAFGVLAIQAVAQNPFNPMTTPVPFVTVNETKSPMAVMVYEKMTGEGGVVKGGMRRYMGQGRECLKAGETRTWTIDEAKRSRMGVYAQMTTTADCRVLADNKHEICKTEVDIGAFGGFKVKAPQPGKCVLEGFTPPKKS